MATCDMDAEEAWDRLELHLDQALLEEYFDDLLEHRQQPRVVNAYAPLQHGQQVVDLGQPALSKPTGMQSSLQNLALPAVWKT